MLVVAYFVIVNFRSDSQNDLQSLDRRLDEMLYLLVKKPREKFSWQFPQGSVDNGESLVEVKPISWYALLAN